MRTWSTCILPGNEKPDLRTICNFKRVGRMIELCGDEARYGGGDGEAR